MESKFRIPMQFFAEDAGSSNSNGDSNSQGSTGDQNQNQSGAVFSQADLNRIGAQEKANGKKSMLKELGFEDEQAAKDAIAAYNKYLESQQSEAEKTQTALNTATKAQVTAENRATLAEHKCSILMEQGNPKYVDDIMALANARVNDERTFEDALKSVKEDFPSFFSLDFSSSDTSTGGNINPKKATNNTGSTGIGIRLAQSRLSSSVAKNPYFK